MSNEKDIKCGNEGCILYETKRKNNCDGTYIYVEQCCNYKPLKVRRYKEKK